MTSFFLQLNQTIYYSYLWTQETNSNASSFSPDKMFFPGQNVFNPGQNVFNPEQNVFCPGQKKIVLAKKVHICL